jgi:hypothetical protein
MVSEEFINECKNYAYENRYGKIEFSSPSLELNQSNKIQEFTIDGGCYVDGDIVGSVYVKKFNANLIDALDDTIENREFDASVGVKYTVTEEVEDEDVETEVTEYIDMGSYIVEKPKDEQTENLTSFVGYDLLMQHLDEKYQTSLDYENETITIADVYDELCTTLELTPVTTTFTNSTIEVEANPFVGGETNRIVLNAIAKVACAFVDIDYSTNEIDLKWLSSSLDYTFATSDFSSLEGGKTVYGPINSLILKSGAVDSENVSQEDAESIAQNGEHQLVISEDYFLYNETKRQEALTAIWNKVNGLTYTECTLTTYTGKPFLKIGDKIRIYLDEENYIDSYVLQHNFTYDGAFKSIIKCPVLTEQEVKTKQNVSLGEKLRQTEIIVNKQEGTISSTVSRVSDIETKENNDYIELMGKFNDYEPSGNYSQLETRLSTLETDTYLKTEIQSILKGTYYDENNNQIVSEIVKTNSATFDENGMTYEKSGANTKTTINEVGVNVKDNNNNSILFAGYVDNNNTQYSAYQGQTIVATDNIMVDHYLVVGSHSRFEDYETGTGCFYIG